MQLLLKPITDCKELLHVPKMFFIQGCRNTGELHEGEYELDGIYDARQMQTFHSAKDCFYFFSSARGNASVRSKTHSVFIDILCSKMDQYGQDFDMETIAKAVCLDMTTTEGVNITRSSLKSLMAPMVEHCLTKKIFFHKPSKSIIHELPNGKKRCFDKASYDSVTDDQPKLIISIGHKSKDIMPAYTSRMAELQLDAGMTLGIKHITKWPTFDYCGSHFHMTQLSYDAYSSYSEDVSFKHGTFCIISSYEVNQTTRRERQYIGIKITSNHSEPLTFSWETTILQKGKMLKQFQLKNTFTKSRHGKWFVPFVDDEDDIEICINIKILSYA